MTVQEHTLKLTRTFHAPRQKVFSAWTDPQEIRKWWKPGDGWALNIAEVDLRIGGKFRIGVKSTTGDTVHFVSGVFREVLPPEKLVYTWVVEDPGLRNRETLVIVKFFDRNGFTEVVLSHQQLQEDKLREQVTFGWTAVLQGLTELLGGP